MLNEIFEKDNETLIIYDEIHDSLTPAYHKFTVKNIVGTSIARLGLSATIDGKTEYQINDDLITKIEMLNSFCPIIYKHTINDGFEQKTARELIFYVIRNKLDNSAKYIEAGSKTNKFYVTEQQMYEYLDKQFKKSLFLPKSNTSRDFMIRNAAAKRAALLYTIESKINIAKELLSKIFDKTIVFGNNIQSLEKITPYCVTSNNSEDVNKSIIRDFNSGAIQCIGSFKMLQQGANLKDLNVCVLHSYYGKTKQFIQMIGRLRQNGKKGHVFIIVTDNTQEQVWFNNMTEDINIEIFHCKTVDDAVKIYHKNK